MKINTVAPFEGELVWLGEMRKGVSQKGKEWQSIDFVIKFKDGNYDQQLNLQAFGAEKVGTLMAAPMGSRLRVEWFPSSREYNGRWYTNAEAREITVVEEPATPQSGTKLPDGGEYHKRTQAPTFPNAKTVTDDEDGEGFPF